MKHAPELWFKQDFEKDADSILDRAVFLERETPLFKAMEILKREFYEDGFGNRNNYGKNVVGRIDLIFRWKSKEYAAEVKYIPFKGNGDFWDALKILGYCELYKWEYKKMIHPAIIIPIDKIKLEHKIVANKLKIGLFGIKKEKHQFKMIPINFDRDYSL